MKTIGNWIKKSPQAAMWLGVAVMVIGAVACIPSGAGIPAIIAGAKIFAVGAAVASAQAISDTSTKGMSASDAFKARVPIVAGIVSVGVDAGKGIGKVFSRKGNSEEKEKTLTKKEKKSLFSSKKPSSPYGSRFDENTPLLAESRRASMEAPIPLTSNRGSMPPAYASVNGDVSRPVSTSSVTSIYPPIGLTTETLPSLVGKEFSKVGMYNDEPVMANTKDKTERYAFPKQMGDIYFELLAKRTGDVISITKNDRTGEITAPTVSQKQVTRSPSAASHHTI